MKTTSSCGCHQASVCDSSIAELPRYYPRQLITPDDLTLEQNYFRDRMRRHNRLLHGWGVVCGALVCPVPSPPGSDWTGPFVPWQVQVQKGYMLGPYGDEIILDCSRTVDLRTAGVSGVTGEPCVDMVDPWCSQVFTPPEKSTLFIAVKYKQCMTRPVRVQPAGCGCSDASCEYSRWHDGYEIGVLQDCPPCNDSTSKLTAGYNAQGVPDFESLTQGGIPDCPDCHCGPWVGLAAVKVSADGSIESIDNCFCRRLVQTFSQFWWVCKGPAPVVTNADPKSLKADGTDQQVIVTGENFGCGAMASLGPDIVVKHAQVKDSKTLVLTVNVPVGTTGKFDVTVNNADGTSATLTSGVTAVASVAPSGKGAGGAGAGATGTSPAKPSTVRKKGGKISAPPGP
jgi:IPT/TIG domain